MSAASIEAMNIVFPILWGILCLAAMAALSQHGSAE
jgi:hypothetical protein